MVSVLVSVSALVADWDADWDWEDGLAPAALASLGAAGGYLAKKEKRLPCFRATAGAAFFLVVDIWEASAGVPLLLLSRDGPMGSGPVPASGGGCYWLLMLIYAVAIY